MPNCFRCDRPHEFASSHSLLRSHPPRLLRRVGPEHRSELPFARSVVTSDAPNKGLLMSPTSDQSHRRATGTGCPAMEPPMELRPDLTAAAIERRTVSRCECARAVGCRHDRRIRECSLAHFSTGQTTRRLRSQGRARTLLIMETLITTYKLHCEVHAKILWPNRSDAVDFETELCE